MTNEQEQIKHLTAAVQELLGIVCGMAGIISQLSGIDKIDTSTAVANGKALIPSFVSSYTHVVATKAVSSIAAQARKS